MMWHGLAWLKNVPDAHPIQFKFPVQFKFWHLYRQLLAGGYRGALFDAIYRDEVQDFTQVRARLHTLSLIHI